MSAINRKFRERDIDSPASHPGVTAVLKALKRRSDGPGRQVKALREYEIAAMLQHCDALGQREVYRRIAARDAAIIAVGFAGALRRSEICGLRFEGVEFIGGPDETPGMYLHIRRSKTDQYARGQRVAIPDGKRIRPVSRIHRWLTLAGIRPGSPVFQTLRRGGRLTGRALSRSDVPRLVKRYVCSIGLDPAEYSGHSLRAGFVTSAAAHHARLDKIMEVTRHRSAGMVLRYIRQADAFEDHAGEDFL
ncbi:MAG: site-specific integrase [Chloroflexi bacterium]|nr:site-specific integrase [Chloroflexota bacterium]